MTSHTFDLANHVSTRLVREHYANYDGGVVTSTVQFMRDGTFIIAAGKVGEKDYFGKDTFQAGLVVSTRIKGTQGDFKTVELPISIRSGYWAVGIFLRESDIPTRPCSFSQNQGCELALPRKNFNGLLATVGIIASVIGIYAITEVFLPESAFRTFNRPSDSGTHYRSSADYKSLEERDVERQSAGVAAMLRSAEPKASEAAIQRETKAIIDDWQRNKR